jgi:2-dehydro-3-deoxyphosphogluconate aldolase/(4S)-4-hydroxy-2-oxoglutarate aldolase
MSSDRVGKASDSGPAGPESLEGVFGRIRQIGIVPVVEITDAARAVPLAQALAAGGIPIVEVTFRTPAAAEALGRVAREAPQVLLIAGTVTSIAQADLARDAGAAMLVAPGLNRDVVEHALDIGLPMMPGVLTPTEVEAALLLGLPAVKLFPIEPVGGVRYVRALAAPYPTMKWNPMGGISAASLPEYLKVASVLACGGSWIAPRADIEAGRFEEVAARAAEAVRIVRDVRGEPATTAPLPGAQP